MRVQDKECRLQKTILCVTISWYKNTFRSIPDVQLTFQDGETLSTREWAEFRGPIPTLDTFSCCLWFFVKYFSVTENIIWQYCTLNRPTDPIKCSQLGKIKLAKNRKLFLYLFVFSFSTRCLFRRP